MIHSSILNKWVMEEGGKSSQIHLVKTMVFLLSSIVSLSISSGHAWLVMSLVKTDWLTVYIKAPKCLMSKTYTQTARQQIHSESSPSSSSPQLMSQFDVCWPADWLLNRGTSSESRFAYEFVHSLIVEQNLLLLPRFAFSFTFIPATAISSHYLEGPPPPTLKSNQQLPVRSF